MLYLWGLIVTFLVLLSFRPALSGGSRGGSSSAPAPSISVPGPGSLLMDWRTAGRNVQPTCVDIKPEMHLCHGIGYNKMRLPNLLGHDSIAEVTHQAASWVPLINIRCHNNAQLFLCSLFSPVCLDRPIYPCRSLCQQVRQGCEKRMKAYGYPWPQMFSCDRFPEDDDMCISDQTRSQTHEEEEECEAESDDECTICNQADTYENILDQFCRADFAVRVKIQKVRKARIVCRKAKVLKGGEKYMKQLKKPVMVMDPAESSCCQRMASSANNENFLIMGSVREAKVVPSFIMPWAAKNSKSFKRAVRMFKKLNCTDSKLLPQPIVEAALTSGVPLIISSTSRPPMVSSTIKASNAKQTKKKVSKRVLS